jgi:3-oxoadipate enol-lactonase
MASRARERGGSAASSLSPARGARPRPLRAEPIKAALASHAIADDGTRIYFETFSPEGGSARCGGPHAEGVLPVLLVMGVGANGRLWAPVVRRLLAAGYEVIAVDNRGCGRSSTPWRPWTTRTMARDAMAVLDQLAIDRAHVSGGSLGGMIAQELALEFPERVITLVLGSTTGGLPRLDLAPWRGLLRIIFDAGLRSLRPGSDPEQRVRDFICTAASEDFAAQCRPEDEAWTTVAAMLEDPASQRGLAMQLLACARHSSWSRLPRLTIPVQVHHGTEDRLMPFAAGRELARRIPGAQFVVHEGAGHATILERPEESRESVLAFLAECEAPPSASSGDASRGANA